jgi:cullin 3
LYTVGHSLQSTSQLLKFNTIQIIYTATHKYAMANTAYQGLNGPDVDFQTTWNVLETAFREIHTKNASALSFEELYRNAYKIVLKKKGEELYNKVAQFEEQWLSQNVRTSIVKTLTAPLTVNDGPGRTLATANERRQAGETFLRKLRQAWEDHQVCMGMLTDVLMYMVSPQGAE